MQRRLTLSKNAYLWEEGDQARNIAVVEQGKINYHPHSGWFDEGPSKGPFNARVQPKERGRVDARSLITYGA